MLNLRRHITRKSTGRHNECGIYAVLKFYKIENIAVRQCANKLNCCNRFVRFNLQTGC